MEDIVRRELAGCAIWTDELTLLHWVAVREGLTSNEVEEPGHGGDGGDRELHSAILYLFD